MFAKFKKNRIIKSYIKQLPVLLRKDYGKAKYYKPKDIMATVVKNDLDDLYVSYAISMFSKKSTFNQYYEKARQGCNYDEIRSDIAESYFNGYTGFSSVDIWSLAIKSGVTADSGEFNSSSDGGIND